jgi:hypothetical protein
MKGERMTKRDWIRAYRLVFALAGIIAMAYQFIHSYNDNDDFRVSNFFSFFTIQSNIIVAVVLLIAGLTSLGDHPTRRFDLIRGAAVSYIALVGVVYGVLLSGYQEELQTSLHWVNNTVHKIIPLVMVADWLIDRPRTRISFRDALYWMIYPLVYLAYTLIRGPIVDWWPYPFLNPHHEDQGYGVVAIYCIGIALGFMLFIWIVAWLSRREPDETAAVARA